jgi:hypothetical protein
MKRLVNKREEYRSSKEGRIWINGAVRITKDEMIIERERR